MLHVIKKVFPFTAQGFFALVLASLLLAAGITRADLAALFWGAAFLVIAVYTLAAGHLYRLYVQRYMQKNPGSCSLYLPDKGVFPGEEIRYKLDVHLPRLALPGFNCLLVIPLHTRGKKEFRIKQQLTPGSNILAASLIAGSRGVYSGSAFQFHFRDVIGFTRSVFSLPAGETIKIFPDTRETGTLPYKTRGTESTDKVKSKKANNELLEVRKYYPGDDTRKINWKMLAHIDELFLRKGEETPPPDSRLLFILDPTVSPYIHRKIEADYLDALTGAGCSLMLSQLATGSSLLLAVPGMNNALSYYSRNRQELLELLAGIEWQEEALECPLPAKQNLNGIIFSTPGSLALPGILRALKTRNWQINLFFRDFLFPAREKWLLQFKDILFIPGKSRVQQDYTKLEKGFRSRLAEELAKYRDQPWRLENIGIL